jgi:GNAT superfamily N-acetyltransferase
VGGIDAVRERLLERYLGFAHGGLHFEERDISAEIAEARRMLVQALGRELRPPDRPNRSIWLWVVADETGEKVGKAAREVGLRGSALTVAHKQLRIRRPEWRRRGFGSALLAQNEDWYRECGVEFIVMEAEGDGSAFAARRGFDFDVTSYGSRPRFTGLPERELRFAAVDRLIHHPSINETVDGEPGPRRESVLAFLQRLERRGAQSAGQVDRFRRRLPASCGDGREETLTGDELTFTAPDEIAAFGQDEPLAGLDGRSLGLAVLALTSWSGIKTPRPTALPGAGTGRVPPWLGPGG